MNKTKQEIKFNNPDVNEDLIGKTIIQCLKNNDPDGVMKVISEYILTFNKTQIAKHASIPRTTLYHSLRCKNPTVKTLAKLVYASTSQMKE